MGCVNCALRDGVKDAKMPSGTSSLGRGVAQKQDLNWCFLYSDADSSALATPVQLPLKNKRKRRSNRRKRGPNYVTVSALLTDIRVMWDALFSKILCLTSENYIYFMGHKGGISFDCQPWAHSSFLLHTAWSGGWLLMIWAVPIYTYQRFKLPLCTTLTVLYFGTSQANNPIVSHVFWTTNIQQVIKLHKQTGFSQQQINTSPCLVFVEFDKPPTLLPPHSCYVCPQPSSSFIPTLLHPVSKGRHSLLINCWNSASSLVHGIEMGMEL